MPQSTMNGHSEKIVNGHGSTSTGRSLMSGYEMCDGNFLFTSESVGEGHPGKLFRYYKRREVPYHFFFCYCLKKKD